MSNITNLAGTRWLLNSSLDDESEYVGSFSLNFRSELADFVSIDISVGASGLRKLSYGRESAPASVVYSDGLWSSSSSTSPFGYREIAISGGSDAGSEELISWLSENAVQINPGISSVRVGGSDFDVKDAVARREVSEKQAKLESGVTIKTLNGNSLLGSGNIKIVPNKVNLPFSSVDSLKHNTIQYIYGVIGEDPAFVNVQVTGASGNFSGAWWHIWNDPDGTGYSVELLVPDDEHHRMYYRMMTNVSLSAQLGADILQSDGKYDLAKFRIIADTTMFKTVNGESVVGSGNITVPVPSMGYTVDE